MSSIKRFKAPEIKLNKINNNTYNTLNSINNYINNNINSINNINEEFDISNIELDIPTAKGHSSSSYSDQEDILINGICSKITNDVQNCFDDDDITYDSQQALYPIFSSIVSGKKLSDLIDENGCIKSLNNIITDSDKEKIMKQNNLTSNELENIISEMNKCLTDESGENLKIVDYLDKMSSNIMNCKINEIVHEKSGFDAVVLEETNGNLMPIISGTNTGQTRDLFADLYPIINSDKQLSDSMESLDNLLNFNLYEDKLQSLMDLKKDHDDIYWTLIDAIAKRITEHSGININGLVQLLGHLPDVLNIPGVGDEFAKFILSQFGINENNPNLLSILKLDLGLTNRDMALIEKEGFLTYMQECYQSQRSEAETLVKNTIQKAKDNNVKVDINGYSLGGGLALTSYANICLNDSSMEEYINSVTVYDPAIIHTEREENGSELTGYISKSDKTKLFIIPGDLTATYNNSLNILDKQIFYVEPKKSSTLTNKVNVENSFTNNDIFKTELKTFLKKFNLDTTQSELDYYVQSLEPLRLKYLSKENDSQYNKNSNFILNQIIFNFDSVEDIFFGETHYMSSIDYSLIDEDGNFKKEANQENFVGRVTGNGEEQNVDEGVIPNMSNVVDGIPTEQ